MSYDTEAQAVADLVREGERSLLLNCAEGKAARESIIVFPDKTIKSLAELIEAASANPFRKRAEVSLTELESFTNYVNAHKSASTHIFANIGASSATFAAIIDYHQMGAAGEARWASHVARLHLQVTPEWAKWAGLNAKPIPQVAFAEFLEDNQLDIVDPAAAELIEIAQFLEGKKNVAWKSGRKLQDGSIDFAYSEEIVVSGTSSRRDDAFKMPGLFTLRLRPFPGGEHVNVTCRLRYRIGEDGKLVFIFLMNQPERLIEASINDARRAIAEATALPVLAGAVKVENPNRFVV